MAKEQILKEKFKAGVESCIGTLGQNKLLALESIFCFLLNGKLDFKGYMEILEEASNTVRVEHLNFVKSKFQKDPVTKRLNDAEYSAEVDKTYKFMNSHVREMCCNALQFLKNSNEFLRNGCATALSFGYPFVIPIEKVKRFLLPDVMKELRFCVTREDELFVHLSVKGFRKIQQPVLECISKENWQLFQRPKQNLTAIIALFDLVGCHDKSFVSTLVHPYLLGKLVNYFSPSNPFRTNNPELSKYLEKTISSTKDAKCGVRKKRDDGYGSLVTENPIASLSKKAKINPTVPLSTPSLI